MAEADAIEVVRQGAGKRFDPEIVLALSAQDAAKKPKRLELRSAIPHHLAAGDVQYDAKTKLLTVELPQGGDVSVVIGM